MYWLIKYKSIFIVMAVLAVSLAFGSMTFAVACTTNADCKVAGQTCQGGTCKAAPAGSDVFGLEEFDKGVGGTLGNQDLRFTIGKIINVALSLLGVVAVVIVLLGGFKWMTAGGNEEKTTEARNLIFAGVIGLAIILSAWAIALFVLKSLATATGSGVEGIPDF